VYEKPAFWVDDEKVEKAGFWVDEKPAFWVDDEKVEKAGFWVDDEKPTF
jgi:hypothetical protein